MRSQLRAASRLNLKSTYLALYSYSALSWRAGTAQSDPDTGARTPQNRSIEGSAPDTAVKEIVGCELCFRGLRLLMSTILVMDAGAGDDRFSSSNSDQIT